MGERRDIDGFDDVIIEEAVVSIGEICRELTEEKHEED